jgi:NarL family two-component system response regulator LiaR
MATMKIICIVEDKSELRDAMAAMVEMTDGLIAAGSYASAEEATPAICRLKPHAVLMDINLPGASGVACVATLKNQFPKMLFLMCTAYEDNDKIFNSLRRGQAATS